MGGLLLVLYLFLRFLLVFCVLTIK